MTTEEIFDGRFIDLRSVHRVHSIELRRRDQDTIEMTIRFQEAGIKSRMTLVCDISNT